MLIDQIRPVRRDLGLHRFQILAAEKSVDFWIALSEIDIVEDFYRQDRLQANGGLQSPDAKLLMR